MYKFIGIKKLISSRDITLTLKNTKWSQNIIYRTTHRTTCNILDSVVRLPDYMAKFDQILFI